MNSSTVLESSNPESDSPAIAFAALGDPARLAILRLLRAGTSCTCELAPRLGMAPSLLSYHLRILREAALVERKRSGRRIEYRARPTTLRELAVQVIGLAIGDEDED